MSQLQPCRQIGSDGEKQKYELELDAALAVQPSLLPSVVLS